MDFFGNAASSQILILMAFPIVGAIFFAGVIFISLARRRKKSKMKLGIQPKTSLASEASPMVPANDPQAKSSPRENALDEPEHELDTSVLSGGQSTPAFPAEMTGITTGDDLSTRAIAHNAESKTFALDTPPQTYDEKIDLAARLPDSRSLPAVPLAQEPGELMRLLRDPQSGQLIVEIAGQRYTKLADITDKKLGQYILKLAAHLLAFTGGKIATEAGVKSVYTPKVGETPEPMSVPTPGSQRPDRLADTLSQPTSKNSGTDSEEPPLIPRPSPEAEAKFLASIRNQPPQTPLEDPPQRQGGLFGRVTSSPEPILPGLNLADEINKIVQTRLIVSPLAESTELEITADPDGGIRIKVNDTYYSSPDDIPDPAVKKLIKASIKQWERS